MADLKKRILSFANGRQVRLFGNSLAVNKSMEISEGYAPNIFSYATAETGDKSTPVVSNPHKLTKDELLELADFNIRLWMDLKDSIRQHGINNIKIFNRQEIL